MHFAFLLHLPEISLKHIEPALEIARAAAAQLVTRYGYLYLHREHCDAARGGVLAGLLAANRLTEADTNTTQTEQAKEIQSIYTFTGVEFRGVGHLLGLA